MQNRRMTMKNFPVKHSLVFKENTCAVSLSKYKKCFPSLFPAGFALQVYRGAQKPTPMEVMKSQATRLTDNVAAQKATPPKMEIPTVEGRRQGARPHKLKPRDMNILTPSGF